MSKIINLLDLLPADITNEILLFFDDKKDLDTYINFTEKLQNRYAKDQPIWKYFCEQRNILYLDNYCDRYYYYLEWNTRSHNIASGSPSIATGISNVVVGESYTRMPNIAIGYPSIATGVSTIALGYSSRITSAVRISLPEYLDIDKWSVKIDPER